ncbi:SAM-dependent methyltransferase [Paraburkholderia sp. GAS333]|uniref:methyltransferase domain-containing protein n=1 Tax=Paraburkholderia sp. GAS333 TaxID=3156279 RepID=UPI003D209B0F
MNRPEETAGFWDQFDKQDLMQRCASLHQQRREAAEAKGGEEIAIVRRTVAHMFIQGNGIEVGAGSRPFPIPPDATCFYGDVRDHDQLAKYFSTEAVTVSGRIDAQTLDTIPLDSLDFVISAHVIEHLYDPVGAMKAAIWRLKPDGVFLLVVPDMTQTWDRRRPATPLEHVLADEIDGGEGSRLQAYIEHCRYVHPEMTGETLAEADIDRLARQNMRDGMDLHVHAWPEAGFFEMVDHVARAMDCRIEARLSAVNENLYVVRRG